MKKLLMGIVSVFVLMNTSFAQGVQQKVDSLKQVQAQAKRKTEAAKKVLKESMNDKNYQAAAAAQKEYDRIGEELKAVIDAEAKRAAKEAEEAAKAEAAARAAAKKAEDERVQALYKQRFPAFEFVDEVLDEDLEDGLKEFILENLRKDPNWDIKEIRKLSHEEQYETVHYHEFFLGDFVCIGSNGSKSRKLIGFRAASLALKYHRDPVLFYEAIQERAAQDKMNAVFKAYYLGYTGERITVWDRCTKTIALYKQTMPKDKRYYYVMSYFTDSCDAPFETRRILKASFTPVEPGSTYVYHECDGEPDYMVGKVIALSDKVEIIASRYANGRHEVFPDSDDPNIIGVSLDHGNFDSRCAAFKRELNKEPVPRELIKTFKVEDYK